MPNFNKEIAKCSTTLYRNIYSSMDRAQLTSLIALFIFNFQTVLNFFNQVSFPISSHVYVCIACECVCVCVQACVCVVHICTKTFTHLPNIVDMDLVPQKAALVLAETHT